MTRLRLLPAVSVILVALMPLAASAQGAPPQPPAASAPATVSAAEAGPAKQAMAACRGDIVALCGGLEKGGGRKMQCLKDNEAKLSAPCKSAIQAVVDNKAAAGPKLARGEGRGKVQKACQTDIATVCAGVEKGKGAIARCLKDNAAKLSPTCGQAVTERQAMGVMRKGARAACAADRQALCGTAEKGKAMFLCLREKQAQASPGCQQALASLPEPRKGNRASGTATQGAPTSAPQTSAQPPAPAQR